MIEKRIPAEVKNPINPKVRMRISTGIYAVLFIVFYEIFVRLDKNASARINKMFYISLFSAFGNIRSRK
jgi:hypothetical protein